MKGILLLVVRARRKKCKAKKGYPFAKRSLLLSSPLLAGTWRRVLLPSPATLTLLSTVISLAARRLKRVT